jgi:hypothetical protein
VKDANGTEESPNFEIVAEKVTSDDRLTIQTPSSMWSNLISPFQTPSKLQEQDSIKITIDGSGRNDEQFICGLVITPNNVKSTEEGKMAAKKKATKKKATKKAAKKTTRKKAKR